MPVADFGAPDVPCPLQLPLHPSFAKLTNPTPNLLAAAFRPGKLGRHATTEFENSSSDVRDRVWYTRTSGSYQSHAALKGLPPIAYSVTSSNIAACIQSAHQSLPSTSRASLSTSGAYLPNYPLIPAPSLKPRTIHQRSTVRRMNGSGHQASY